MYQRYSLLNFVGVLLSKKYRVPLILEFNGSEVWVDEHWSQRRWLRLKFLVQWVERYNLEQAHTILVVSQVLKELLIEQGVVPEKIVVHPNGVDSAMFDPVQLISSREQIRAALSLQNTVTFGFIGTFSYWHGVDVLSAMIPAVVRQWPQARFILIGDGPLRHSLQSALEQEPLCKERVHFLGTILQHEARNYLAVCDAFLSPTQPNPDGSRFFGSPTKLFEYMSLAKPVIVSDIEQLAHVVSPALKITDMQDHFLVGDEVGIVVRPDDVQGFIRAAGLIAQLAQEQRDVLGNHARNKIVTQYTWRHHVQTLVQHIAAR